MLSSDSRNFSQIFFPFRMIFWISLTKIVFFCRLIPGASSLLAAVLAQQQQQQQQHQISLLTASSVEGASDREESIPKVKSENLSSMLLLQPQVSFASLSSSPPSSPKTKKKPQRNKCNSICFCSFRLLVSFVWFVCVEWFRANMQRRSFGFVLRFRHFVRVANIALYCVRLTNWIINEISSKIIFILFFLCCPRRTRKLFLLLIGCHVTHFERRKGAVIVISMKWTLILATVKMRKNAVIFLPWINFNEKTANDDIVSRVFTNQKWKRNEKKICFNISFVLSDDMKHHVFGRRAKNGEKNL